MSASAKVAEERSRTPEACATDGTSTSVSANSARDAARRDSIRGEGSGLNECFLAAKGDVAPALQDIVAGGAIGE